MLKPFVRHSCLAILVILLTVSCGKGASKRTPTDNNNVDGAQYSGSESIIEDESLEKEGVAVALSDVLASLADSHGESTSSSAQLYLGATTQIEDNSQYERSCTVNETGDEAKVVSEHTIDRTLTVNTARRQRTIVQKGSDKMTRQWSKVGIGCASNTKHVKLDWDSNTIKGLTLDVDVQRQRDVTIETTLVAKSQKFSLTKSFSARGKRSIKWLSHTVSDDDQTITRELEMTSEIVRTHKRKNSQGEEKTLTLEVDVNRDAPLVIENTRQKLADASKYQLVQRVIKSGQVVAKRANDGNIVTSFENLVVKFSTKECYIDSGKVIYSFYKKDSDTPLKVFELTYESGEYTLKDQQTGEEILDFEADECALADFR